ncbi:MAG: hypothetical protein ACI8W8_001904 [Rhodothermales bacterium]|jgi:hypothetical protein
MTKTEIRRETDVLIAELPEETSWDDLMHRIYVRQKIERGRGDCEAGRTATSSEIRSRLGLTQ